MLFRAAAFAAAVALSFACGPASAATTTKNPTLDTLGTGLAVAMPLFAGGVALYHHDRAGIGELASETFLTVGTAYALKEIVRERRPDGSDWHSFPSGTTALSASGSSFLWGRYGWEWGLPAMAVTQFVSYTRVETKQHHWYDTLASSGIAIGYATIVTRRFHARNVSTSLDATPDGATLRLAWKF
jgi:membrane-associated phospholipid phosphatase